jgi:hypothetical protein
LAHLGIASAGRVYNKKDGLIKPSFFIKEF